MIVSWKLGIVMGTTLATMLVAVQCKLPQTSSSSQGNKPPTIAYESTIKPIVQNYCTTCHSGDDPAASIDLSTYEEVKKQAENGVLLKRIHSKSMPMPPSGLMPKNLRIMFNDWAQSGYLKVMGDKSEVSPNQEYSFDPPVIKPVNVEFEGFEFMEQMQGHWVGKMNIMGQKMDWFAFDYRAISTSHVHGIYEGGSIGNLFTSFFVCNFKGVKTIMARNGGILNGIYRTSYFVLEKFENKSGKTHYEFVDAYGGRDIMWMELTFEGEQLAFNSYTSRFGSSGDPLLHMQFKAQRRKTDLAKKAAIELSYPKNQIEKSFENGLPMPEWGEQYPVVTSASYVVEDKGKTLEELAQMSGDPFTVSDMPHLAKLSISIQKQDKVHSYKTQIYLSQEPLTNEKGQLIMEHGYLKERNGNSILSFPEIAGEESGFTFTYLHPGNYYLTVVADVNGDHYPSKGDITSPSKKIMVAPKSHKTIEVKDLTIQN